jgi:hypothetical protein
MLSTLSIICGEWHHFEEAGGVYTPTVNLLKKNKGSRNKEQGGS